MPTREEIEKWALEDYEKVVGRTFFIEEFSGYVDSNSVDFTLDEPIKVKVVKTPKMDILHWNDSNWMDPYWDLEILEIPPALAARYPDLTKVTSPYMFGDSYSRDGKMQPARIDPRPEGPRDWSPRGDFDRRRR